MILIGLEIKMFMKMQNNMRRSWIARNQNLRNLEEGIIEVVFAYDWLSPTNINQLLEALVNKKGDTVKIRIFQCSIVPKEGSDST